MSITELEAWDRETGLILINGGTNFGPVEIEKSDSFEILKGEIKATCLSDRTLDTGSRETGDLPIHVSPYSTSQEISLGPRGRPHLKTLG